MWLLCVALDGAVFSDMSEVGVGHADDVEVLRLEFSMCVLMQRLRVLRMMVMRMKATSDSATAPST